MKGKQVLYALSAIIAFTYLLQSTPEGITAILPEGSPSPTLEGVMRFSRMTIPWRILYLFHHGTPLHMLANAMCLIAIARSDFRVPLHFVIMALIVAICAPMSTIPTAAPATIGSSGICYALLGAMSWQSFLPKRYHAIIGVFIAAGALPFFHINYTLHAFCYIEGVLYGWICKK